MRTEKGSGLTPQCQHPCACVSRPDGKPHRSAQVNCTLRSMFAAQGIGRTARAGRLEKAMEVVCGDRKQTSLELNMSFCEELVDITPLAKLGELQSLQQLTLSLWQCSWLVDVAPLAKLGELQSLQQLTLNLNLCERLVDITPLAKLGELRSLQQLTLDLRGCRKLPSRMMKEFTNLAEFLAACESGALRLVLRRRAAQA